MSAWILGIFAVAAALLGAVLAANALDIGISTFGFGLIGFGIWFVFWLINDHFDEEERSQTGRGAGTWL